MGCCSNQFKSFLNQFLRLTLNYLNFTTNTLVIKHKISQLLSTQKIFMKRLDFLLIIKLIIQYKDKANIKYLGCILNLQSNFRPSIYFTLFLYKLQLIQSLVDFMNPPCFICQEAATKACIHHSCNEQAFLCSGSCVHQASLKIHRHAQQTNFISIQDINNKITQIKEKMSPNAHQKYLEMMKKKVTVLKQMLDELVLKHQLDFKQLTFSLNESVLQIYEMIENNEFKSLKGKHLNMLFQQKIIYQNQLLTQNSLKSIKKRQIDDLENIEKIINSFIPYKTRKQQSSILFQQAKKVYSQKKYQQSSIMFQKAKQKNNFDYQIPLYAGITYYQMNNMHNMNKAKDFITQSLTLFDSSQGNIYLAKIYQKKTVYQKSLKYYNKALQFQNNAQYLNDRGQLLFKMKRYKDAKVDFQQAVEINECKKYLDNLGKTYKELSIQVQKKQSLSKK